MKTADLTGALLDYWTARAEGIPAEQLSISQVRNAAQGTPESYCLCERLRDGVNTGSMRMRYSTEWSIGGPLLEKHRIDLVSGIDPVNYQAEILCPSRDAGEGYYWAFMHGDTALIAICRAVVRAAFGDEVEDLP